MTPQRTVGIRELRNGLNGYVDEVAAGTEIVVTVRGKPVARLEPIDSSPDPLAELRRRGLVNEPTRAATKARARRRVQVQGGMEDLMRDQRR